MGIVLSGGTIVTAVDQYQADLRIDGERISAIGESIEQPGDRIVDVEGCYLFPGGIDPHTHFDLPVGDMATADDFASGTKAALMGGTTTVIDFATQFKGENLTEALANWHLKAKGKAYTDYGFHMAITNWDDALLAEMPKLIKDEGVSSFKFYMSYKNVMQVDDSTLLKAFKQSKKYGALVCLHCENGDIIDTLKHDLLEKGDTTPEYHAKAHPIAAEAEATARAIVLAQVAQAPLYVVHLSCEESLKVVTEAKRRGVEVYAETCPQYLLLDDSYYTSDFNSSKYVISPPLRPAANKTALWQALANDCLNTVATDHCSFNYVGQKDKGIKDFSEIPNGMPGVENRLALLYSYGVVPGKISLNQFVNLTSTQAAKLFGLFPRKGTIAIGSDADIVVWNPKQTSVISAANQLQRVDYNPYEGFKQDGRAEHVFLRGRQVVQNNRLVSEQPSGSYLSRKAFETGKVEENVYIKG